MLDVVVNVDVVGSVEANTELIVLVARVDIVGVAVYEIAGSEIAATVEAEVKGEDTVE